MGLDTVELVMDVEEHFGVLLREASRERIRTIGDLADAILEEIAIVSSKPCPTMRAFYELRAKIRGSLSIPELRIRPSAKLIDLIPLSRRRACWNAIQTVQPCQFPGLTWSRGTGISLLVGIVFCYLAPFMLLPFDAWILSVIIGSLLAIFLGKWMTRFRLEIPRSLVTVGDLVRSASSANASIRLDLKTKEMVLSELFPIVSEQFGVKIERLTARSRFVEDLGAD